jgi:short-subunit dehydrogenase
MNLTNSKVLITGSKKGIGLALAKAFAKEHAKLILVQRNFNEETSTKLIALGAKSVETILCDLSKPDEVQNLCRQLQLQGKTEPIDILVNNAGVLTGELLENQSDQEIINIFQVNLTAGILLTKAVLSEMIKRNSGLIVSNCSVSSYMRFPCATTYAATKAGLLAFTECLENELSGTKVRTLSLITPGIKTEMFEAIGATYGKYFKVPNYSITSEDYAAMVIDAIKNDKTYLFPKGTERVGLILAKYFPKIFKSIVIQNFNRSGV